MSVPVARRNLFAEKGRFAISVAGVAFAVLILIVLALYRGFSRTGETFKLLPGDLWVVQDGTTDPFHSLSLLREVADRVIWFEDGRIKDIGSLARDPVCGMSVEEQNAPASLEHAGKTYYFCSRGCSWEFQESPERFIDPRRSKGGSP